MKDFSTYSAERDFARQVKKVKEDCATTLDESLDHLQDEFNALLSKYDALGEKCERLEEKCDELEREADELRKKVRQYEMAYGNV